MPRTFGVHSLPPQQCWRATIRAAAQLPVVVQARRLARCLLCWDTSRGVHNTCFRRLALCLQQRAKELVPGGQMVIVNFTLDEQGYSDFDINLTPFRRSLPPMPSS